MSATLGSEDVRVVESRQCELSKFVSDQLDIFLISSRRTALRVIARLARQQSMWRNSLPRTADEGRKGMPPVFIVTGDESQ